MLIVFQAEYSWWVPTLAVLIVGFVITNVTWWAFRFSTFCALGGWKQLGPLQWARAIQIALAGTALLLVLAQVWASPAPSVGPEVSALVEP